MRLSYLNGGAFSGYGVLAAFGVTSDEQSKLSASMDNVVDVLRRAILSVRTRVAGETTAENLMRFLVPLGFLFTSTAEAKAAVLSAMATMSNIVDRLDGPSRAEVLSGSLPVNKWLASAKEVEDGVAAQLKILGDESTINLIRAQIRDFYIPPALKMPESFPWWGWALVGVGGVLAVGILLKVAAASPVGRVARALSGRSRRRSRKRGYSWFDPEQRDLEGYRRRK